MHTQRPSIFSTLALALTLAGCQAPGSSNPTGAQWLVTPIQARSQFVAARDQRQLKRQEREAAVEAETPDEFDDPEVEKQKDPKAAYRAEVAKLMADQQWQQALSRVESALLDGPDAELTIAKGQILLHLNQPAPAADAFEAVLKDSPTHSEALYGRARAALVMGDAKLSLSYIERLKAGAHTKPAVYRLEAMALESIGDSAGALAALKKAGNDDPQAVLARGNALARAKDFTGASKDLAASAAAHPTDASTQLQYGTALAQSGELETAAEVLARATALAPTNTRAWRNLAGVYERLGQPAAAARAWSNLISNVPSADPTGRIKTRIKILNAKGVGSNSRPDQ